MAQAGGCLPTSGAKHETQVRLSALAALLALGQRFALVILLITGISMHYSEPGAPPFGFRADVLIHNASGILLTLFYGLFLFGNFVLGMAATTRLWPAISNRD